MMALVRNPSSSSAPLDETNSPWKIKVQIVRMSKANDQEPHNSTEMVLLDSSSGTRIHTTIGEKFSKWIQEIENGKINKPNNGEVGIDIREDLLITNCGDPIEAMVNKVFGGSFPQSYNPDTCQEMAILCSRSEHADKINDYMISKLSGKEKDFLSADSISPSHATPNDYMFYRMEDLNSIDILGLPKHCLKLKVGAPVMLLKDILGVRKGTRLQITGLGDFVLVARVITHGNDGETIFIPRIPAYPEDANFPIKMRRMQYPLALAFAMTINESRDDQTLSKVGLYLPRGAFSRGRVNVAISKAKTKAGLKVLVIDRDGERQDESTDVVFKEVFQNV